MALTKKTLLYNVHRSKNSLIYINNFYKSSKKKILLC